MAPATTLGRWAVALLLVNVAATVLWRVLPGGGALGLAAGAAGGVLALVAILRHGERAAIVFVATVPLVFVVVFLVAEVLLPH